MHCICVHLDAMNWLLWIPCHSVWVHVGSCFIQRLSSYFSPTSLAFDCTIFVLVMMTRWKKMKRQRKRRSKRTHRTEKPQALWKNPHQQTQAEGQVCVTSWVYIALCVCFDPYLSFRAEDTGMLWWTASMVSWWLHSVAWWRSSTGRVRSGPCFAFVLCRWVFTYQIFNQYCDCSNTWIIFHRLAVRLWGLHMLCC